MQTMIDTGLNSLIIIAKHFGIPSDIRQLERAYSLEKGTVDTVTILRAAKDLKLKVRKLDNVESSKFKVLNFPAIVRLKNENYVVVFGTDGERIAIIDPLLSPNIIEADWNKFTENWSGEVILFTKRFTLNDKISKFELSWFIPSIIKYKKLLLQVLLISFILQLCGLAAPLFTQVIIDKVLVHRSLNTLDIMIIGMILIAVFQNWMTSLRSYIFNHTTNKIDVSLSSRMFKTITALPMKFFQKWQVGEVVSRVGELENLRSFLTGSSLTLVLDLLFAIIYLGVMFFYSNTLSLVVMLMLPLFILLNVSIAPLYKKLINNKFLIGAENQSFLIETITGMRTVKSMTIERQFVRKYEEILAKYVNSVFSVINLTNIAGSIGGFLQQTFNLAILWVGAYYVMEQKITVGELIAFQMMAGQLIAPIMRIISTWQYFQQARVSVERLGDIMNEETEPAFNPNRTTLPNINGEIVLDKVSFRYNPEGKPVLQNINLVIPAGTKVGIVGKSGSGKSTLTQLIQRLYLPESGRILIDGVDIAQVEPAWLRRQVGVVLQENFLFGGTIEENIAIAAPNATKEQIINAAKMAGADEFIEQMQHKYDTFVGERGSLLSGGQKQRISIARALLTDPKILIFDEATSALDYESEKIIMDNLEKITQGRTTLMIAHRLSTVKSCEAIIVMDRGNIVEVGSHEQLIMAKGYYYNLYATQNI